MAVILPESVEDVASSFYEGVFAELCEQYGMERAHELLAIYTKDERISKEMIDTGENYIMT